MHHSCYVCGKVIGVGEPRYAKFEPEIFVHYGCVHDMKSAEPLAAMSEVKRAWQSVRAVACPERSDPAAAA